MTAPTVDPQMLAIHGDFRRIATDGTADVVTRQEVRTYEIVPSAPAGLRLPKVRHGSTATIGGVLLLGAMITVWNSGSATLTVKKASGAALSADNTVAAGACATYVLVANSTQDGEWKRCRLVTTVEVGTAIAIDAFRFDLIIDRPEANVSWLARAIAAGYDGSLPAITTCTIRPDVQIGSISTSIPAFDMGESVTTLTGAITWAAGSRFRLTNSGTIGGAGGAGGGGGVGGTGSSNGGTGINGGKAARLTRNISIANSGQIQGGGGGGGGGGGQASIATRHGGGGGGGAGVSVAANGLVSGGRGGSGPGDPVNGSAQPGGQGSRDYGGVGGTGINGGATGGTGGDPAIDGVAGSSVGGGGSGGAGGLAGAAISKASGVTITWLITGTVLGSEVTE